MSGEAPPVPVLEVEGERTFDSSLARLKLEIALVRSTTDYDRYVRTDGLFSCQKAAVDLVNEDELVFQIVHQVEELWMKTACHLLIDIEAALHRRDGEHAIRRFRPLHRLLGLMNQQLRVLDCLTPESYAEIRDGLGQGSGQDSPGYRELQKRLQSLWDSYRRYLERQSCRLQDVYDATDAQFEPFVLAECLVKADLRLAEFRTVHFALVERVLGLETVSLKGKPTASLAATLDKRCFPELWAARGAAGRL